MPATYEIDRGRRLIDVRFTGPVAIADLEEARLRVTGDPTYQAGFALLIDMLAADVNPLGSSDLRERARRLPGAGPMAIVVGSDFAFGMARMYEQVSPAPVSVFRTRPEALEWLHVPA